MLERRRQEGDPEALRRRAERDALDRTRGAVLAHLLAEAKARGASLVVPARDDGERAGRVLEALRRVDDPALARARGGALEGLPFQLVEDFRDARPLGVVLADEGRPHWREAQALGRELARALAALEDAGLVHEGVGLDTVHVDRSWRVRLTVDVRLLREISGGGEPRAALRSLGRVLLALLEGAAETPPWLARIAERLASETAPATTLTALVLLKEPGGGSVCPPG